MKRVLVPLAEGFEEMEAVTTIDILRRAGLEVVSAGLPGSVVRGSKGVQIIADKKIEDVDPKNFDILVLPGGNPGYKNLGLSRKVEQIIREFDSSKKIIAAICAAPSVLARLGVLDSRMATIYPGMERELPKPRSGRVVIDGHVITSQGPGTAVEFSLKIIEKILGKQKALELSRELVY